VLLGAVSAGALGPALRAIYVEEYLPAAWLRADPRPARMLLPAAESGEGWRAYVRARDAAAGTAHDPPWFRELAWRAALALVAIGLVRDMATFDQAVDMLSAESGLDPAEARLQALHVARRPLAALTFISGRRQVAAVLARGGPGRGADGGGLDRRRLLAAGPLPGALIDGGR
jgi:hypothetical protein